MTTINHEAINLSNTTATEIAVLTNTDIPDDARDAYNWAVKKYNFHAVSYRGHRGGRREDVLAAMAKHMLVISEIRGLAAMDGISIH